MSGQDFVDMDVDTETATHLAALITKAIEDARARIRREEVEPLREALREMLTEAEAYEENGSRFDRERNERARAALRAADERGR